MCTCVPGVGATTPRVTPSARQGRALVGFSIFAIAILAPLSATPALAQTTGAATLVGTVTDSSGAVVPAAQVTVVNVETSFRSETQTGPEGNYYVPYLSPGTYRITLEAAGFKRYVRDGVTIRTGFGRPPPTSSLARYAVVKN